MFTRYPCALVLFLPGVLLLSCTMQQDSDSSKAIHLSDSGRSDLPLVEIVEVKELDDLSYDAVLLNVCRDRTLANFGHGFPFASLPSKAENWHSSTVFLIILRKDFDADLLSDLASACHESLKSQKGPRRYKIVFCFEECEEHKVSE